MKSIYDSTLPESLKRTQEWFGGVIGRAIDEDNRINPLAPSGEPIEKEASLYIRPSPTLEPYQRIQIYNQQYWWRLLSTLQEIFPLTLRLFGYHDFNQTIGVPYLLKHPPADWVLNDIGVFLPDWLKENYLEKDQQLVVDAAILDCAHNQGFLSEELPHLDVNQFPVPGEVSSIFEEPLQLQPHICLFEWSYSFFTFRDAVIKESVDYWAEHDFPKLVKGKKQFFVLYRDPHLNMARKELSFAEFTLLSQFKKGASIEEACAFLEEVDADLTEEAVAKLAVWFHEWTALNWLSFGIK